MMVMVMGTQRETIEIPSEARTKQRRSSRTSMLTPLTYFFFFGGGGGPWGPHGAGGTYPTVGA